MDSKAPWWIALAQLVLGTGLIVAAALVPNTGSLHDVGVLLLGSAVGGALLPKIERRTGAQS